MNICKTRRFPDHYYDLYKIKKHDRGKWLNTWFSPNDFIGKKKKRYIFNAYWTLKKCDNITMEQLYYRRYNPISLKITEFNSKPLMCCRIHSIDDGSFGIWFENYTVQELEFKRLEIMRRIDSVKEVNGEEFLNWCINLGADIQTIDYD